MFGINSGEMDTERNLYVPLRIEYIRFIELKYFLSTPKWRVHENLANLAKHLQFTDFERVLATCYFIIVFNILVHVSLKICLFFFIK